MLSEPLRPSRVGRKRDDVESGESDYQQLRSDGGKETFSISGGSSSSSLSSPERQLKLLKITVAVLAVLCVLFLVAAVALAVRGPKEESVPATPTVPSSSSSTGGSSHTGLPPPDLPPVQVDTRVLQRIGRDMDSTRNLSADPCNDWSNYACGGWYANTTIPANASSVTKGFEEAAAVNARYVHQILHEDWPIIQPLYDSCVNVDAIEALAIAPIQDLLHMLNPATSPIQDVGQLYGLLGRLRHGMGIPLTLQLNVFANFSNPRMAIPYLSVGGTTISGRNSWMSYIGQYNVTARLVAGISAMLQLVGDSPPDALAAAQSIVGFETALVNITARAMIRRTSLTLQQEYEQEQQLGAQDGVFELHEIVELAPSLPVVQFLNGSGALPTMTAHNVPLRFFLQDNGSFPLTSELIAATPLSTLLQYARWHVINASTPYLSLQFQQVHAEHFADLLPFDQQRAERAAVPPRNDSCSAQTVGLLPDLVGRYFVQKRLPDQVKTVARDLITWIRDAFRRNLPSVAWMDEKTRAAALEKALAVLELVGGPEADTWSDYSELTIRRTHYFDNVFQLRRLRCDEEWTLLTRPISRRVFIMPASIVNAAYSPLANSMVFPAGILQEPFFSFDYPMAMNLGRIGMVMGHELLHGFDNTGRQFDKDGFRRQWWDDDVIARFNDKAQCLVYQYSNITVQGSRVNGRGTLGENIADNGGLHMAFLALQWYKQQLADSGLSDPLPPSSAPLTTDQLFFWGYSQLWCTKSTDAAIARQIITDVHSPGQVRAWAPLVNQLGFHEAFNCPVGSRMNPAVQCDLY